MTQLIENENMPGPDLAMAMKIATAVDQLGGKSYFVGGYVRDELLGIHSQDIDIEIHGITPDQLKEIIRSFGELVEDGADFGVYGIEGYDLDLALPRKEVAVGKGHKDFQVSVEPFIGTKDAAMRRDFTINALMKNVITGEIVDHFHGVDHLRDGIICHVNDQAFAEDPLRLFRGAQFAARFQCRMAEATLELCRSMDVSTLPKERVFKEMKKALMKADKPSIFFEELRKMNQLSVWFPEVEALIGVPQNTKYHQEGDAWVHTMLALDEAAKTRELVKQPFSFMIAVLIHDLGKATATEFSKGAYHAYGHEIKGLKPGKIFLERIWGEKGLEEYALNMMKLHMRVHAMAAAKSVIKKTNQLFDDSVEPFDLIYVAEADDKATINDQENHEDHTSFLLKRLSIYQEIMSRPYIMGRDLIQAGLKPGSKFSEILSYAHKLRLAGVSKEEALQQTVAYGQKIMKKSK